MTQGFRYLIFLAAGTVLLLLCQWLGSRGYAVTLSWHGLVFLAGVLSLLYAAIGLAALQFKMDNLNRRLLFVSVSFCLVLLEFIVRILGMDLTYIEQRLGWYQSSYQQDLKDSLRVHRHYMEFWMETPEYRYHRKVNKHGFADFEFTPKIEGELLIQTYGDSFTEGDGAPADSSYPALLRNIFTEKGMSHVKLQNFGMSGSDPGFYWRQLHDVGVQMNPDIVVITYCSLDLTTDFFTRGGLERFHDNGWSAMKGPWWEFIYANSHLYRWLARVTKGVDVAGFLTTPRQRDERLRELEPKWNTTFDSIAALADRHGFDVLLVKKPERSEIDLAVYQHDFSFFDRALSESPILRHIDLLDHYINERKFTADSTLHYYWAKDGHHNPTGYHLMADAIAQGLESEFSALLKSGEGE